MVFDKNEAVRYLGYKGTEPDAEMSAIIDRCADELLHVITPRSTWVECSLSFPNRTVKIEDMVIDSRSLFRNLKGCEKAVLFAATLGIEADRLIAVKTVLRMSEAVICQAVAAALIETCCDETGEEICRHYEKEGYFLRPRFSPGYGDVALSHQKDFCRLLNASKKIGLTVTEGDLLVPVKSVTAVIGLSRQNSDCHQKGCEECNKTDCEFRR